MKKRALNSQEVKKIELDILLFFDSFCKKNNLIYFLAYGTLLGAVRHKGFIPWDDDIDVMMPRTHYERLISIFDNSSRYKLYNYKTDKLYNLPLTKLCDTSTHLIQKYDYNEKRQLGVYIDVFVIDDFDFNTLNLVGRVYRKAQRIRYFWKKSICKNSSKDFSSIIKKILSIPFKIIGPRYFAKKYDLYCSSFSGDDSSFEGVMLFGEHYSKDIFQKGFFSNSIDISFENHLFPAPTDYVEYLTKIYGDYLTLPPVEKRKSHGFDAYVYE